MKNTNYSSFVKIKDSKEFRNKIKEFDISLLMEDVQSEPQLWADLLIQHKIFPVELYNLYSSQKEKEDLISSFIIGDFLPDISFIESLIENNSDDLLFKLVNKFPSLNFDTKRVMSMINSGMKESIIQLVKNNKNLQNKEIFLILMNSNLKDAELISTIKKTEYYKEIIDTLFKDICNKKEITNISDEILSLVIIEIDKSNKFWLRENLYNEILNREISYEALHSLVTFLYVKNSYLRTKDETVNYHPKFEAIPIDDFEVSIVNVPKESKFRSSFVIEFPSNSEVSSSELKQLLVDNDHSSYNILNSSRREKVLNAFIQKSSLSEFESHIGSEVPFIEGNYKPSGLSDVLIFSSEREEKSVILHNLLSYKFKKRLENTIIPKERIPKNKNKKSYFDEVLISIRSEDVESFRDFTTNYGYSLTKFLFDCKQTSKLSKVERVRVGHDLFEKLTKEEISLFLESGFSCTYYFKRITPEEYPFSFKLDTDLASTLYDNFQDWEIVYYLDESLRVDFLRGLKLSNYASDNLLNDVKKGFLSQEIKELVERKLCTEKDSIELSESNVEAITKTLSKEDILRKAEPVSILGFLDMKKDNEFVLTEEELKQIILKFVNSSRLYYIESYSFLKSLNKRSNEFCKEWISAYLGGNTHMTNFLGEKVSIRRGQKELYNSFSAQANSGRDVLIKDIIERGSYLNDFQKSFADYDEVIKNEVPEGTIIKINDRFSFDFIESNPHINFEIENLTIGRYSNDLDGNHPLPNVKIKAIDLVGYNQNFLKLIEAYEVPIENISYEETTSFLFEILDFEEDNKLFNFLCEKKNAIGIIQEYIGLGACELSKDIKRDEVLINNGLILSDEVLDKVIHEVLEDADVDYLLFLESKIGKLPMVNISEEFLKSEYSFMQDKIKELKSFVKERNFPILTEKEYLIDKIKKGLIIEGVNFEPINLELLTLEQKMELIDFICSEIDPRFLEIGIKSFNINSLNTLENFNVMKTMTSLNEEDVINILNIPNNVKNNPKIIKGVIDLMTLNSGNFTYKVFLCKQVFEKINTKETLNLGDFIDYSNVKDIKESESLSKININSLKFLDEKTDEIQNKILKGCNKKQILRFFRSIEDVQVLKDSFDMLNQIYSGKARLEESVPTLTDEEEITSCKETIYNINTRLNEIICMDDITHMHDRLIPLTSFIKENPNQPIGTAKFKKLNSMDLESELGNNLFFPQNRGDVHYLGNTYGWCVTGACHYTNGVMNKGNVLVGICEKGMPAEKENVIALGHFLNTNGKLRLEQLRWSKLKKNGERNVSAVQNFNYQKIIDYIEVFMEKEKKGK